MLRQDLLKIIEDIEVIESKDVMRESIENKLKKSLEIYNKDLNKSYNELIEQDYTKVAKAIIKESKCTIY